MFVMAWVACSVPATSPESGGLGPCEAPTLGEWTGPAPATPDDAALCPAGAYSYYAPGNVEACGGGTRVDCTGVPYSASFRYDAADVLIGVVYCSDTEDYCDGASYCITYGDHGGC